MLRICKDCEEEFDDSIPHHRNTGYINQCYYCGRKKEVTRYIGRVSGETKTGSGIEIFREPSEIKKARTVLKRECAAGFNANLSLSNPAAKDFSEEEEIDGKVDVG